MLLFNVLSKTSLHVEVEGCLQHLITTSGFFTPSCRVQGAKKMLAFVFSPNKLDLVLDYLIITSQFPMEKKHRPFERSASW